MKTYDTIKDCIDDNGFYDSRRHFIKYNIVLDDGVYNVIVDGHWVKAFSFRSQAEAYLNKIRNKTA